MNTAAPADPNHARRRIADKAFLGPEFVTWLYFTLAEEGYELAIPEAFTGRGVEAPDDGIVRFAIGKRTSLHSLDDTGARVALTGPGLDDSGEVLQAVRRGAYVDLLALEMACASRVYAFTLNARDGSLTGVRLPDLFTEPEDGDGAVVDDKARPKKPKLPFEDVLSLRMTCLDELERVVDCLFERFVSRRLASAWHSGDRAAIARRVAEGLDARRVNA